MMNLDLFSDSPLHAPAVGGVTLPHSSGYHSRWCNYINGYVITVPHAQLIYIPALLPSKLCARSIEYFLENNTATLNPNQIGRLNPQDYEWSNIPWTQGRIKVYGKSHLEPRLSSWHGDGAAKYRYSHMTLRPNPWNKGLRYLKEIVERTCGTNFNSVLLNCYRDGQDSVSWHSDDEYELGNNPVVASLSVGEARRFLLRNIVNPTEKIEFILSNGDLLMMGKGVQRHYQHCVPKALTVQRLRINLTYRKIL